VKTWCVAIIVAALCGVAVGRVAAQAETKAVPQVPDDAKNQYATLQIRGAGLADAMALLQKELDSVNAERARLVQRLAAAQPDYDLVQAGALAVAYAPKKSSPPKKEQ